MNQLFGLQHRNRVGSSVHFLQKSLEISTKNSTFAPKI